MQHASEQSGNKTTKGGKEERHTNQMGKTDTTKNHNNSNQRISKRLMQIPIKKKKRKIQHKETGTKDQYKWG